MELREREARGVSGEGGGGEGGGSATAAHERAKEDVKGMTVVRQSGDGAGC